LSKKVANLKAMMNEKR